MITGLSALLLHFSFFRYCFGVYRKVFFVVKAVGSMNNEGYIVVELLLIAGIKRLAQHFDDVYGCLR